MTIREVQDAFANRTKEKPSEQTFVQLANALASKCGRINGSAKFADRGDPEYDPTLNRKFLASTAAYLFLIANRLDINLSDAIREEFNAKSDEFQSTVYLR